MRGAAMLSAVDPAMPTEPPLSPGIPSWAAGCVVFGSAAGVLVLEILAGRLLAPYVGVTLQTYTGIIGTVLAGIAVGTWCGGALADRVDPRVLVGPLIVLGGALSLATIPLVRLFGDAFAGGGIVAIVALAAVGFFAPAAVLSAASPTVVKLRLRSLDETGSVVGRLSALGTLGAIAGTFVTGFVLVTAAPVTTLIVVLGVSLVVAGMVLWLWLSRQSPALMMWSVLASLAGLGAVVVVGVPCDVETTYYCARVEVDPQRPSGRLLILDDLRHSYVDLDDPTHLEFRYAGLFADALDTVVPPGTSVEALHVGGGGFTMPRYVAATRPGSRSLVLEVDPGIVDLARDRLGLRTGPDLRVQVGDARLEITDLRSDSQDVVFGDAFGGLAVPWHLTTREFASELDRVLKPDGAYILNVIDRPATAFVRAEAATLREVFEHVVVIAPPAGQVGRQGSNFVVVGSQAPIDTAALTQRARSGAVVEEVLHGTALVDWIGSARALTDDHAPVDQLVLLG
jgi:SAM-dependent methyltransferase